MKILNFGSCNIDNVYELDHIVTPGETIASDSLTHFPGGKGLNQSVAIARSGEAVYHAGCIGPDGDFLKNVLTDAGADVSYLQTVDTLTGCAIIQVDHGGENSIILYPGANHTIDKPYVDKVLANFDEGDILVLQNEISNLDYIIKKGAEKKMKIVFNPSPFEEKLRNIDLNKISVLILNEIEASAFTGKEEPNAICDYFVTHYENMAVVLTLGSKGAVYADKNGKVSCPAYSVEVKDTTSAGDTFTGYFISQLVHKTEILKALKYASAAAAIAVSRKGASSSIPSKEELEQIMPNLTPNIKPDNAIEARKSKISKYLSCHLADASLEDLASCVNYSPSHMAAWIKKHMGVTYSELIQKTRCDEAARLLRDTTKPVGEIIEICGYKNESFFRKVFKTYYLKNPLSYRKSYYGGKDDKRTNA